MRIVLAALVFTLLTLLVGCGGAAKPVEAPAWARTALATGDADFVGGIDLNAMRSDPLLGAIIKRYAKNNDVGAFEHATQIDLFANATEHGGVATWIAVVHGVTGRPTRADFGSSAEGAVVLPNAWLVGEGPAFDRAKQMNPSAEIAMPSRALLVSTVRGRGLIQRRHQALDQMSEGLHDATVVVLGGSHLEFIGQFHYVDDAAAKRAAAFAKLMLAAVAKGDWSAKIAAAFGKIDFDVSGDTVSVRYTLDDEVRDALVTILESDKR